MGVATVGLARPPRLGTKMRPYPAIAENTIHCFPSRTNIIKLTDRNRSAVVLNILHACKPADIPVTFSDLPAVGLQEALRLGAVATCHLSEMASEQKKLTVPASGSSPAAMLADCKRQKTDTEAVLKRRVRNSGGSRDFSLHFFPVTVLEFVLKALISEGDVVSPLRSPHGAAYG